MPAIGGIRLALVATGSRRAPSAEAGSRSGPGAARRRRPRRETRASSSRWGRTACPSSTCCRSTTPRGRACSRRTPLVFELPAHGARRRAARGLITAGAGGRPRRRDHRAVRAGQHARAGRLHDAPLARRDLVIEQPLPMPLKHVAVVAQKVGEMQLSSPQMPSSRRCPPTADLYIAGRAARCRRATCCVHVSPACRITRLAAERRARRWRCSSWPAAHGRPSAARNGTARTSGTRGSRRAGSAVRRADRARGAPPDGAADPEHYAARRRELVTALERVYAALDDEAAVARVGWPWTSTDRSRRHPQLRPPPRAQPRVAHLSRRRDRRAARRRTAPASPRCSRSPPPCSALVGHGALRRPTARAGARRCAPASACSRTTCTSIPSSPPRRTSRSSRGSRPRRRRSRRRRGARARRPRGSPRRSGRDVLARHAAAARARARAAARAAAGAARRAVHRPRRRRVAALRARLRPPRGRRSSW